MMTGAMNTTAIREPDEYDFAHAWEAMFMCIYLQHGSGNDEHEPQLGRHPEAGQWQTGVEELCCCCIRQLAWRVVTNEWITYHEVLTSRGSTMWLKIQLLTDGSETVGSDPPPGLHIVLRAFYIPAQSLCMEACKPFLSSHHLELPLNCCHIEVSPRLCCLQDTGELLSTVLTVPCIVITGHRWIIVQSPDNTVLLQVTDKLLSTVPTVPCIVITGQVNYCPQF